MTTLSNIEGLKIAGPSRRASKKQAIAAVAKIHSLMKAHGLTITT